MNNKTVGYTESGGYKCLEDLELTYDHIATSPLVLTYCGKEDCDPGWCFGPYVRDNYVIHVVVSGNGIYRTRGKVYHLSAGQAFVIYPGEETLYQADPDTPWSYMWVGFNGMKARSVVEEVGFSVDEPVITLSGTEEIGIAIDKILEARELTVSNELRRLGAFYEVMALMIEMNIRERAKSYFSDARYVNMAVDLIVDHYNERVRIAEIADQVGVNRSYLSNLFRQEMHMSPQSFLINFRLEKAAQMLKETQDSVGSIAAAVGYTDSLSFSKAFKKKYDLSPSAYRNEPPELTEIDTRGGYQGLFKL